MKVKKFKDVAADLVTPVVRGSQIATWRVTQSPKRQVYQIGSGEFIATISILSNRTADSSHAMVKRREGFIKVRAGRFTMERYISNTDDLFSVKIGAINNIVYLDCVGKLNGVSALIELTGWNVPIHPKLIEDPDILDTSGFSEF